MEAVAEGWRARSKAAVRAARAALTRIVSTCSEAQGKGDRHAALGASSLGSIMACMACCKLSFRSIYFKFHLEILGNLKTCCSLKRLFNRTLVDLRAPSPALASGCRSSPHELALN